MVPASIEAPGQRRGDDIADALVRGRWQQPGQSDRFGSRRHVTDRAQRSIPIVGAPWRMSATPPSMSRAAPQLGEQNDYVLGELLGLSAEQRQRLVAEKVIY